MKLDKEKILQDIQSHPSQEEIDYLLSLDEMATVGRSQRDKLLIQVNPAESQGGNAPYFKAFNAAQEQHATLIARIRFDLPLYEIHAMRFNRGKDYWYLNSRDKKKLINYLNAPNTNSPQFTNWQYAILSFNNERSLDFPKTQENLLANGKLLYPDYLPFDLPMPNYELLAPNKDINERIAHQIEGKQLEEAHRIAQAILSGRIR